MEKTSTRRSSRSGFGIEHLNLTHGDTQIAAAPNQLQLGREEVLENDAQALPIDYNGGHSELEHEVRSATAERGFRKRVERERYAFCGLENYKAAWAVTMELKWND
ncbi:MAG: hypothetical protein JSR82_05730 [Verrucomicrobia bacterium]|nr:hypothetical protein [Verrucomicrobiota bacterium]